MALTARSGTYSPVRVLPRTSMHNVSKPTLDDLPTSKQLLRSTFIAIVAAIVVLVAFVLPSEYAIDPTGIGRALGLTEMGEIKT